MRLRVQMPLVAFGTVALFGAATLLIQRTIVTPSFLALEREAAEQDLRRALSTIRGEVEPLALFVRDWSQWDDTYRFIGDRNPAYLKANLQVPTFVNSRLDWMAFYGADGAPVFSKRLTGPNGQATLADWTLTTGRLAPDHPLLAHGPERRNVRGLFNSPLGCLFVASGPITDTPGTAPSRGAVVIGRLISERFVREIETRLGEPLAVWPASTVDARHPEHARLVRLTSGAEPLLIEPSAGRLLGYGLLLDLTGAPALLVRTSSPRDITARGAAVSRLVGLSGLGAGIVVALVLAFVLQRSVFGPLRSLEGHIAALDLDLAAGATPPEELTRRPDEVGRLASAFGSMSARLLKSHRDLAQREAGLSALMASALDGIVIVRTDGSIEDANPAAERLFGARPGGLVGREMSVLLHRPRETDAPAAPSDVAGTSDEWDARRLDGSAFPALVSASVFGDGDGLSLALIVHDISARKAAEEALRLANEGLEARVAARTHELREANERLRLMASVMEGTSDAVVITDLEATILEVNEAFCRQSGYTREEVLGQNPRLLKSNRHDAAFFRALWDRLGSVGHWSGEIWDRRKGGEIYPKWLTINRISDERGQPTYYVGISSDITRMKQAEERLHQLAYFDALTGLPNRTLFQDRLAQAVARCRRHACCAALLFLDLDRFKRVNDSLGHRAGDDLLIETARRLRVRVRETDTLSRLGGDEFTVILNNVERAEDVGRVAEEIIAVLKEPVRIANEELRVGVSVGIALCPDDDETAEGLIRKADAAMYLAKDSGRGTYRFFSRGVEEANRVLLDLERQLQRALDHDEFLLHFQPIFAGQSQTLVGAEALLRWQRPGEAEPLPPDRFLRIAEDTGLILPLGDWVLGAACEQAALWSGLGLDLRVAVNVSARQLEDNGFPERVRSILERHGIEARRVQLELNEAAVVGGVKDAAERLRRLKELGLSLAIDDLGTGRSSLADLKRLPIDRLKIDRSFVREADAGNGDVTIVSAILSVANSLDVRVVAEGVESPTQLDFLLAKGCHEVQGYHLAPPMSAEAFLLFAANRQRAAG